MGGSALDTNLYFGSARNRELIRIEKLKIAFQFLLMTVCSLIIGILISRALSADFYENSVLGVSSHFETIFINCSVAYDYILCIAAYSVYDLVCIIGIFLVSFAAFNYVATDMILVYCGLRFGLSVSFLSAFIKNASFAYSIGIIRYIVFIFFKIAVLLLILNYAYIAAVSSISLRRTASNGRMVISSGALLRFMVYTIACAGSVLILSGLYCWLIYLLK